MPSKLQLFDEYERDAYEPSKYSESHFSYLNRSARPEFVTTRQRLQELFDNFRADNIKREELLGKFKSDDDRHHLGAFFELYMNQLLKNLGYQVEIEPKWSKGKPDFLLTAHDGTRLLLEATSIFAEQEFGSKKKLEDKLIDYINEHLELHGYFLGVGLEDAPKRKDINLPYGKILRFLKSEVNRLDLSEISEHALTEKDLAFEDFPTTFYIDKSQEWKIRFTFLPKKSKARDKPNVRPVGYHSYDTRISTIASSIKSTIDAKYKQFGELDIPFIIAINVLGEVLDSEDIADALFGQETFIFSWDSDESKTGRRPNGAWFGPNGFHKTRVSGALFFKWLYPASMDRKDCILWLHPKASHPIHPEKWQLNQFVPDLNTGENRFVRGISAPAVMGFSDTSED